MNKYMAFCIATVCLFPVWANAAVEPWQFETTNTCAEKLFLKNKYDELLLPTTVRLNRMKQQSENNAVALRKFVETTGRKFEANEIQASYNPLDLLVAEYENARLFLKFLTNQFPQSVAGYASVDCNTNPAVALWATALQTYQDGIERIVIPNDIRLISLLEVIVQPVEPGKFQWADDRMIALVTKMYLEAARRWTGDLSVLNHSEPNFNRQGHREFWFDLVAYLALISRHDYVYALDYYKGLLMCKDEPLTRWFWDEDYLEKIHQQYPDVPCRPGLGIPARLLPKLGSDYFSNNMNELINISGCALLSLGDQMYAACTNALESQPEVLTAAPKEMAVLSGWVRGIPEKLTVSRELVLPVLAEETTSFMPRPIQTARDLREARQRWVYFFHQHQLLVELYQGKQQDEAQSGSIWFQELRRRLPQWELIAKKEWGTVIYSNAEPGEVVGVATPEKSESPKSRDEARLARINAAISRLQTIIGNNGNQPRFRNLLASEYCSRAFLAESTTDVDESISTYRSLLATTELSEFDRVESSLGLVRACLCKAYLVPTEKEKLELAADTILQKVTNNSRLDPVLRNIAGAFSMQWQTLKDQGQPQAVVDWFGWMEQLRQWEKEHSIK